MLKTLKPYNKGYDLPSAVQYVDGLWNQIRSSNFQSIVNFNLTNLSVTQQNFLARLDVFERQAAPFLWDGIRFANFLNACSVIFRLAKRRHRGQLALHYLFYTVINKFQ